MLTTHFGLKNSYLPLKTQLKSFLSFSSPDFMLWCPSSSTALPLCPYLHYSHRTFCTALRLWRGWSAILPDCKLLGIFNSLLSPAPNTVSYLVSFQQIFLELMEKRKKKITLTNLQLLLASCFRSCFSCLLMFITHFLHTFRAIGIYASQCTQSSVILM